MIALKLGTDALKHPLSIFEGRKASALFGSTRIAADLPLICLDCLC